MECVATVHDLINKINMKDGWALDGVSCDGTGCVTQTASRALVALALRPEALADDCARVVLIVTARQAPSPCAAPVIEAERLRRQGALALRKARDGFLVEAVKPGGIDRPWSPAIGGESEAASNIVAPRAAAPRAVDATPSEADLQADD